jgi:hypothetical protein
MADGNCEAVVGIDLGREGGDGKLTESLECVDFTNASPPVLV